MSEDWGDAWELPDYPKLPKLLTNPKTAKKRRHKELMVTDELLEQPVKLSKFTDKHSTKQQDAAAIPVASSGTLTSALADAAASKKPHKQLAKQKKKQKQQQQPDDPKATAPQQLQAAKTTAAVQLQREAKHKAEIPLTEPASAALQQQKQKQNKQPKPKALKLDVADKQQPQQQQKTSAQADSETTPCDESKTAAASKKRKGKGRSAVQDDEQDLLQEHISAEVPASELPVQPQLSKKRTKNKFKQEGVQQMLQEQHNQQKQQLLQGNELHHHHHQPPLPPQQPAQADRQEPFAKKNQTLSEKNKKQKASKVAAASQPNGGSNQAANEAAGVAVPAASAAVKSPSGLGSSGGSKLMQQFKERLQGSRFRQLNEALYTQPGDESFSLMQQQPELFQQYHDGFQQQVKSWPKQPLDAAIAWLRQQPPGLVLADFGCGDARLAASVQQTVHSLDLVASVPGVIACNMAHTPLASGSCDVAVFSLALMGTDYGAFLVEAARLLKKGGKLWIAEVRSRFAGGPKGEDFQPFLNCLQQLGFTLMKKDTSNQMFVVLLLHKQRDGAAAGGSAGAKLVKWPTLKACVYKKR